jgi:acyl-CoA synthetase (AMP-forming)/AMP-acid ligase II
MRAGEILDRAAALRPVGAAVRCGDVALSYAEIRDRAGRLARFFAEDGVRPGERVGLLHRNCHRSFETHFAALHAGAVLTPLDPRLASAELRTVLEDSGATLLVSEPSAFLPLAPMLRKLPGLRRILWTGPIPPFQDPRFGCYENAIAGVPSPPAAAVEPGPEAPAHLYYTSGSTGAPKGVILTRGNLVAHLESAIPELGVDRATGWAHIAPMFHLADAWAIWAVTAAGGTHEILPAFSPGAAVGMLASGRVTMTNLVPTMYNRMVREPGLDAMDFSRVRLLLSGGAAISEETVRRILAGFRCEYAQTYGLTETSPFLTLSLPDPAAPPPAPEDRLRLRCTTGRPMRGVEVRVVGEDQRAVPADGRVIGEIQARGPTVTPGYWRRPEETATAFDGGWLRTGDLAVVGPDGYLTIVDRKKGLIITGGEKVASIEVEQALARHAEVVESAVFGVPDPDLGEAVKAFVVLRHGARTGAEELVAFCRDRLTHFKVPRQVEIVPELPKTGSGKILKRALRAGPSSGVAGPG